MKKSFCFSHYWLVLCILFSFGASGQGTLVIDCPDSLDLTKYRCVLTVQKLNGDPLEAYDTTEWGLTENLERKTFQLAKEDMWPETWIQVLVTKYASNEYFEFPYPHVRETYAIEEKNTHLLISPAGSDATMPGYIQKIPVIEPLPQPKLEHKHYLIIQTDSLIHPDDNEYVLEVGFLDDTPITWKDSDIYRSVKEHNNEEEYKLKKSDDSLVHVKFRVREMEDWTSIYVEDTVLILRKDTTILHISSTEAQITEGFKKLKNEQRARRKKSAWIGFQLFWTEWESRVAYASYYQGHRPYGELLFGTARYTESPRIGSFRRNAPRYPGTIWGPALGTEFNFSWRQNNFILGPKIGVQGSTKLVNAGLHFVYYTDFNRGSLYLKPRVGINFGWPFINLSYAYAIRLGPDYFGSRVNQHQLCINAIIPLKLVVY